MTTTNHELAEAELDYVAGGVDPVAVLQQASTTVSGLMMDALYNYVRSIGDANRGAATRC